MFADVCCAGYYIVKYHDMNRTALIDQIKQTRAALDITSPNAFGINKEAELWNGTMFYDAKSGKIELPNKLGALQLLAKMCGWNKAQQNLVEVIARLRGRGAARNNQCAG
jgi:hypothetical protein